MTTLSEYVRWKTPRQSAKDAKDAKKSMSEIIGVSFGAVMPAKAGIQRLLFSPNLLKALDSRFRGNDGSKGGWLKEVSLSSESIFAIFAFFASFADQSLLLLPSPKSRVPSPGFRGLAL